MGKYTDYIKKTAQDLLAVPSPSGFTHMAADFVKKEFENLGYEPQITQKGAVPSNFSVLPGTQTPAWRLMCALC